MKESLRLHLRAVLRDHEVDLDCGVPAIDLAEYVINILESLKIVEKRDQVKSLRELEEDARQLSRPRKLDWL